MANSDRAKKKRKESESSTDPTDVDEVSDLKKAIGNLDDVISKHIGEEGPAEEATLDTPDGENDPFAPRRSSDPDHIPDQQEQTEQPGPYEQLGTSQEGRAVRGPRVRNAKTRRRRSGVKTIRSDWGDVRSAKLASLSQSGPSAAGDDEPVESRKNRIEFEEARGEGKGAGGREMAAAKIIARIISVVLFLAVVGSIVALATRKGQDSDDRENELALLTQELNGVVTQVAHAKTALEKFWKAPSLDDKLEHVWQASRVKPLMESYYEKHLFPTESNFESASIRSNRAQHHQSELPSELVIASAADHVGVQQDFILRLTTEGYLVDWEASVGYNHHALSKLINQREEEPVTLRVYIIPANYYNYQYSDSRVYQSFAIKVSDDNQPRAYAFAPREGPVCKQLMRFFVNRSQRAVAVTLRMRFPKGGDSGAELLELVKPHWAGD